MRILSLKKNISDIISTKDKNISNKKASDINFVPYNKEWQDNIYNFNRKIKHLYSSNTISNKLIREYMNSYNLSKEKRISSINKNRSKSSKKVWISSLELKHTNDSLNIYIYIFDRKNNFLKKKLAKFSKDMYTKILKLHFKKLYTTKEYRKKDKLKAEKNPIDFMKKNYLKKIDKYIKLFKQKGINILTNTTIKAVFVNFLSKYFYLKKLGIILKRELYIACIRQIIRLNTLKYKSTFITPLKTYLKKIYNKEINFNIVNLKSYHLDSDIITQIISTKAKERKNRITKILRVSLLKTNLHSTGKITIHRKRNNIDRLQNIIIKKNLDIDRALYDSFTLDNQKKIDMNILNGLKYKVISGIRLEASGRLTKRFTAQRSVFKLKYKGTLKDINSSYKGISSPLKRNYIRSNIQYSYINSNNRIGAFGIKGWISSK